jgi:hypothetical protein
MKLSRAASRLRRHGWLARNVSSAAPTAEHVEHLYDAEIRSQPAKGKSLFALRAMTEGAVVFDAQPLIVVANVESSTTTCQACFRPIEQGLLPTSCPSCAELFCSPECLAHARAMGHDIVCGALQDVNAFCAENRMNFPRAAAFMLAKSFSGHPAVEFVDFWRRVNDLVSVPVPADPDALPALWHQGYRLTRAALSSKMSAGADSFFESVFNVRTYARLMGTLRLNSFALHCPLGRAAHVYESTPSPSAPAAAASIASPQGIADSRPVPEAASASTVACATGGGAGCEPADGGGCGSGGCGSGAADEALALEARGGTALYHRPSFVNHDCDPNLSAVMGPFGAFQLVTRRPVPAGEELSITYLDSSLPVNVRRGKLHHGYGFECGCAMCLRQMKELQASKAAEARAALAASAAIPNSQQKLPESTPQRHLASLR